ncbi:hypothetical protein BC938DRAFT_471629 [Jimgerdemannia flammicorona]|uniref:F-box domain-containing protein n=1 Tax=Jimgerdemannia flammicorona TaxID=994334 RepID=A0A433QUM5_9FUNG|nr:hypothetical protein BC938DRAFT_471629 [Jimgerdemannia flammicorona]
MLKFAFVEKSWSQPAIKLLYKHVKFIKYDRIGMYLDKVKKDPLLGNYARTLTLWGLSGPFNTETDLCSLVAACPNVETFFAGKCPPNWVNDAVINSMSLHMQDLKKIVLHHRKRLFGRSFIHAARRWPNLTHLELIDVQGIDEHQHTELFKILRNLKVLRIVRKQINPPFRDRVADGTLRSIGEHIQNLKILEFNNCFRISNPAILKCYGNLNSLECLVLAGCRQIAGNVLADVIMDCGNLRYVNVSRSSFNDEAINMLVASKRGTTTNMENKENLENKENQENGEDKENRGTNGSKENKKGKGGKKNKKGKENKKEGDGEVPEAKSLLPKRIIIFAISDCPNVTINGFVKLANVFLHRIKEGLVDDVTIYAQKNRPNLQRTRIKKLSTNTHLKIICEHETFTVENFYENILYPPPATVTKSPIVDESSSSASSSGIAPNGVLKTGFREYIVVEKSVEKGEKGGKGK